MAAVTYHYMVDLNPECKKDQARVVAAAMQTLLGAMGVPVKTWSDSEGVLFLADEQAVKDLDRALQVYGIYISDDVRYQPEGYA